MKEFIASERARLQALFDEFNRDGSIMVMREDHDAPLPLGLVDSYTVTRVAPKFDAAGNVTTTDFWLMFKSVGYNNGYQYTHTIKVVGWSQDDTYQITDVLARIDLYFESKWCASIGVEPISQSKRVIARIIPGFSEPGVENGAHQVQSRTYRFGIDLHEIDVL